jgi:sugar phosphate permease
MTKQIAKQAGDTSMSTTGRLSLRQNRWIRILLVAFIMHIISFIDRSNISMAIPAMMAELKMSASAIGFATGALFFTLLAV